METSTPRSVTSTSVERPLLSVIVPTHNVRPWVEETLYSIARQDVDSIEVIVVDDRSTDGTDAVVEHYAHTDHRFRLVRATAGGGGQARNLGVELASGRYLVFCDGDDIVPDGAYQAMVDSLESSGSDIVFGDYWKFSSADCWHPTASMSAYGQEASATTFHEHPTLLMSRPCWNKVFRRDFWVTSGITFPDAVRSNDIVPMVRAYLAAASVDVISRVVYLYRDRPGASSMTSRAGSDASLLSYLTQELECARLIAERRDAALASVYSYLIYDRDGFAHLRKYYAGRAPGDSLSGEIVALLEELTNAVGDIPAIDPLKRLTFLLTLRSETEGARAAALLHDRPVLGVREAAELWQALLDAIAGTSLSSLIHRPLILDDLRRTLASEDLEDPAWPTAWQTLVRTVERFDPRVVSSSLPEAEAEADAGNMADRSADVLAERAGLASTMTAMQGGRSIVLTGSTQGAAWPVRPVLVGADRRGNRRVVAPRKMRSMVVDEDVHWSAMFRARDVSLFEHVHAAAEVGGVPVALRGVAGEPGAPRRRDSVIIERWGTTVSATRRRNWVLRGARLVIEPRAGRLVAALRSRLGKQR